MAGLCTGSEWYTSSQGQATLFYRRKAETWEEGTGTGGEGRGDGAGWGARDMRKNCREDEGQYQTRQKGGVGEESR